MSQTSSHISARPPSTSLIASITTTSASSSSATAIAARIRGRTAGWTIASRSRSAAGSAKTIRPSAARSSDPSSRSRSAPEPRDDRIEGRLPGFEDLARDPVRIDDDDARPLSQPASDRRLAAADRPGEPDPERPVGAGRAVGRHRRSVGRELRPCGAVEAAASPSSRSTSCCRTRSSRSSCCRTTSFRTTSCPTRSSRSSCCRTTSCPTRAPDHELPRPAVAGPACCRTRCCRSRCHPTSCSRRASRAAIASESNGCPKMSCSPVRSTPSSGQVIGAARLLEAARTGRGRPRLGRVRHGRRSGPSRAAARRRRSPGPCR